MKRAAIWGLIPAAGVGARIGGNTPKQYRSLLGRSVLAHSFYAIEAAHLSGIAIGISSEDEYWPDFERTLSGHKKLLGAYHGGKERADTILSGLKYLRKFAKSSDWVLVHDAVRPCTLKSDINNLISAAKQHAVGAILATPFSDTLKKVGQNNEIIETVRREDLWCAMTPQIFRLADLSEALTRAREESKEITDEAAAMENIGKRPIVVAGHKSNIKITWPEDFNMAELILKARQEGGGH